MPGNGTYGIKIPHAFVAAFAMFLISSTITGIWWASSFSTRLESLEKDFKDYGRENLPARVSVLESRIGDMLMVLKEIRDELKQRP